MMKDSTKNVSKETMENAIEMKKVETLEFDNAEGFVCDFNTGICGPITQEKEVKK